MNQEVSPHQTLNLPVPGSWTFGRQNREEYNSVVFKSPSLWYLVSIAQVSQANTLVTGDEAPGAQEGICSLFWKRTGKRMGRRPEEKWRAAGLDPLHNTLLPPSISAMNVLWG